MKYENDYSNNEIVTKLINIKEQLPKKQKKLCNYMIENYEHIGIMTVKELAEKANVGTTTVLRVTKNLNFSSFSELKKMFHKATINENSNTWWHLKKSIEDNTSVNSAIQVWGEVTELLGKTMNDTFLKSFQQAVNLMLESERINILGLRSSKVPAKYLEYLLKEFSTKIHQISDDVEFLYDRLLQMTTNEILIAFAHPPYTVQTIEAIKYCNKKGIKTILITNSMSIPIVSNVDLVVKIQASTTQYSIVPTISLIEAIVIEYGRNMSESSTKQLDEIGKILSENKVTISENFSMNNSHKKQ